MDIIIASTLFVITNDGKTYKMKIEEEINQKSFTTEQRKAAINIIYTNNWLLDHTLSVLKEFKINEQHFNILRILKGKHPEVTCPGEIKKVLLNKRGDLTRLLDKLEKMGYVYRCLNAENRRKMDVSITQEGIDTLEVINHKMKQNDNIYENITAEEAKVLNSILDKLRG